jgi:hypothetical protein
MSTQLVFAPVGLDLSMPIVIKGRRIKNGAHVETTSTSSLYVRIRDARGSMMDVKLESIMELNGSTLSRWS